MANIDEPPVVLSGQVFGIKPVLDYATKIATGGLKVRILSGDGISEVKLAPEEAAVLGPALGQNVAWMVRYNVWKMDSGQFGLSVGFVDLVNKSHVGALHGLVEAK